MQRTRPGPELMDLPDVDETQLHRALRYLRRLNAVAGGFRALERHLRAWSRRWEPGCVRTILDVGTGSGDIPLRVRAWGIARGFDLRVTGIDMHEKTIAEAHRLSAGVEGVRILRADALRLGEMFTPGSFDYAHAGLFLHHLDDPEIDTVLLGMDRVASQGLVWNDLVRSRFNLLLARLASVGAGPIVRHDAAASVIAGFVRTEVVARRDRLGLSYLRYTPGPLFYRFTLAGEKP